MKTAHGYVFFFWGGGGGGGFKLVTYLKETKEAKCKTFQVHVFRSLNEKISLLACSNG